MIYNDFLNDDELGTYVQAINSRAKQSMQPGRVTVVSLRDRILESAGKCDWCAISILQQSFEIDHLIALSTGGANAADNLAVACPNCNRSKSAKHPARFAQETYARTGIMTPLIQRVLAYYEIEANVQKSLFDKPQEAPPKLIDDSRDDEPPPYIWVK
jgi:hypothetical protein